MDSADTPSSGLGAFNDQVVVHALNNRPAWGHDSPLAVWLAYLFGVIPASLYVLHDVIDVRWRSTRYSRWFYNLYTVGNVVIIGIVVTYFAMQIEENENKEADHKEAAAIYVVLVLNVYANMKIMRGNVVHSMLFYLAQAFGLRGPATYFPWAGDLVRMISSQFMDDDIPGEGPRVRVLACLVRSVWNAVVNFRSRHTIYTMRYIHRMNVYIMDLRHYSVMATAWVWRCLGDIPPPELPMAVAEHADSLDIFDSMVLDDDAGELPDGQDMEQFVLALDRCSAVLVALVHGDQFQALQSLIIRGQDKDKHSVERRAWMLRGYHMRSRFSSRKKRHNRKLRAPQPQWVDEKDTDDIYRPHKVESKAAAETLGFLTGYCAETIWSLQLMLTLLLGERKFDDEGKLDVDHDDGLAGLKLSGFILAFRKDVRNHKYLADVSKRGANSVLAVLLAYSALSLFATPWTAAVAVWRKFISPPSAPDADDVRVGLPAESSHVAVNKQPRRWLGSAFFRSCCYAGDSDSGDLQTALHDEQAPPTARLSPHEPGFVSWRRPRFDPEVFSQFCLHDLLIHINPAGPSRGKVTQAGKHKRKQSNMAERYRAIAATPRAETASDSTQLGLPTREGDEQLEAGPPSPFFGTGQQASRPIGEAVSATTDSAALPSGQLPTANHPMAAGGSNSGNSFGTAHSAQVVTSYNEHGIAVSETQPRIAVRQARRHAARLRKQLCNNLYEEPQKRTGKAGELSGHAIPPFVMAYVSSVLSVMYHAASAPDQQADRIESFDTKEYEECAKGRLALLGLTDFYRQLAAVRRVHVGQDGVRAAAAADRKRMLSDISARRIGAACELTLEIGPAVLFKMETPDGADVTDSVATVQHVVDWALTPGVVRERPLSKQRRILLHRFLRVFTRDVVPAMMKAHPRSIGRNGGHFGVKLAVLFSSLFCGAQAKAEWRARHADMCSTKMVNSEGGRRDWVLGLESVLETFPSMSTGGQAGQASAQDLVPAWQRDDVHAMVALHATVSAASDLLRVGELPETMLEAQRRRPAFEGQMSQGSRDMPSNQQLAPWLCTRSAGEENLFHGLTQPLDDPMLPEEVAERVHAVEAPREATIEQVFAKAGVLLGAKLVETHTLLSETLDPTGPPSNFRDVQIVKDPLYRASGSTDHAPVSLGNSRELMEAVHPGDSPRGGGSGGGGTGGVSMSPSGAPASVRVGQMDLIPRPAGVVQPSLRATPSVTETQNEKIHDTC